MSRPLIDFASAAAVARWSAIDDAVMGGVSRSQLQHDPAGHAIFSGIVSLEHNGGFASVRIHSYLIDLCGDGKRYKLNLRTDNSFDGVNYQAVFEAPAHLWTQLSLPRTDFQPSYRGRRVPGAPPFDPARLQQIGLMIADRQAGPFALAIRSIGFE